MNKKIDLRLAFVDTRHWYSPNLLKSLNALYPGFVSHIYLPKWYRTEQLPRNKSSNSGKVFDSSKVWGKYSYPFDVFKRTVADQVDIVHVQWELNTFGSFYSSLLLPLLLFFLHISRAKCVTTVHSVIPRSSFGLKLPGFVVPRGVKFFVEFLFVLLYNMVVLMSDAIIVHGASSKKLLCFDYKSKSEKIFVIPYGVASEVQNERSSCKLNNLPFEGQELILAIGTISPRKGLDVLIEAFEKLSLEHPSWILAIAGGVPMYYKYYYEYLKELASNLTTKNRVVFIGEFNLSDVNMLMKATKVVVFPYIYNFGASSTLTFALQHRKVVVISALDFATDFLNNGKNALLVKPGNPILLAKAIESAMSDQELRITIKKGVNNLLQKTSWDFVAKKTLEVYTKVLFGGI